MQPVLKLLDTWGALPAAEVKDAGYDGQMFYVPVAGVSSKSPQRLDLEAFTAAGLIYGWVYEANPDSPDGGVPNAQADWRAAHAGFASLGIPFPKTCYFPQDAIVSDVPKLLAYYTELSSLGQADGVEPGVYGSDTVCAWVRGVVKHYWQTGAGSRAMLAWADMYQGAPADVFGYPQVTIAGRTCDQNAVWTTTSGLEDLNGPWPKGEPEVNKRIITVKAGSDGQVQHLADIPWASLVAATVVNGPGPHQVIASVDIVPGHPEFSYLVVKGAAPHQTVQVLVAFSAPSGSAVAGATQ